MMTQALMDAGTEALKAADTKNAEGILAAGEHINTTCDNCHQRYWRQ
jgi:cytochrome c556